MFRSDMAAPWRGHFFKRAGTPGAAAEITSQVSRAFRATGLTLDIANAHKHFPSSSVIGD